MYHHQNQGQGWVQINSPCRWDPLWIQHCLREQVGDAKDAKDGKDESCFDWWWWQLSSVNEQKNHKFDNIYDWYNLVTMKIIMMMVVVIFLFQAGSEGRTRESRTRGACKATWGDNTMVIINLVIILFLTSMAILSIIISIVVITIIARPTAPDWSLR